MPSQICVVGSNLSRTLLYKSCCGSKNSTGIKHLYPKDNLFFNIWVDKCDNKMLRNLTKIEPYEKYVVCNFYFEKNYKILGTIPLYRDAKPTL